jgi:DNA mismatch repair protein MutL
MNQLDKINEMLECINLKLEPFSLTSVVVRELPTFIEGDEEKFIQQLVEEITNDKEMSVLDIRKEKIASLACHASVKFNSFLTVEESRKLLSRLSRCGQPFNCPHGRPTMISITDKQLEKEFKRV